LTYRFSMRKLRPYMQQRWPLTLRSWAWRPLFIVAVGILFVFIYWKVPVALYRKSVAGEDAKLKAITDTRTGLLAGLVGVGALLTFWLNGRVYRITARTFELTEQGHITDRYTKAIEQLGSKELAVRLGGIYALERLAHDSPERDHPTVVEVLSAFVREGSKRHSTQRSKKLAAEGTDAANPETPIEPARLATDVQAALTVLGRLPHRPDGTRGDLSDAQLVGAQLTGANLSGAQLSGVNLSHAVIDTTNLSGAALPAAKLSGARTYRVDLSGANLSGADVSDALIRNTDLSGTRLDHADLSNTTLFRSNLSNSNLSKADLSGARLYRLNMSGAWLDNADLTGTQLERMNLQKARGLEQNQVNAALAKTMTWLPDNLQRPDHWPAEQAPGITLPRSEPHQ
jgi:uncharacterized protein YjbI with pentapeptide repeats